MGGHGAAAGCCPAAYRLLRLAPATAHRASHRGPLPGCMLHVTAEGPRTPIVRQLRAGWCVWFVRSGVAGRPLGWLARAAAAARRLGLVRALGGASGPEQALLGRNGGWYLGVCCGRGAAVGSLAVRLLAE